MDTELLEIANRTLGEIHDQLIALVKCSRVSDEQKIIIKKTDHLAFRVAVLLEAEQLDNKAINNG